MSRTRTKPKKSDRARLRRAAERAEHKAEKKEIKQAKKRAKAKGLTVNNQLLAAGVKLSRTRASIEILEEQVKARTRSIVASSLSQGSTYDDQIKPADRDDFRRLLTLYERAKELESEIAAHLQQEQNVGLAKDLPLLISHGREINTATTGNDMTKPKDTFLEEMEKAMGDSKPTSTTTSPSTPPSAIDQQLDYLRAVYGQDAEDLAPYLSGGPYSSPPTTHSSGDSVGKSNYFSSDAGKILLITATGSVDGPYTVTHSYKDWWDEGKKVYPVEDKLMTIPFEACDFTYGSVKFNPCVFTASDDYLGARWGRKLDSSDKTWLAEHQFATDQGIPAEYMPICIHAMMEPYGMGVSRVRVRRGALSAGEAMGQFMESLGVNPFAAVDRQTSNKEAAEKLGISEEEANRLFKFEFHDDPIPGCTIVGEKGWTNTNSVSTGSYGGHSRYLAPRSSPGNWYVSIALAPIEQIDYVTPIEVPEYKKRKGDATLNLSSVKRPDGKPVGVMVKGNYYSPEDAEELQKPTTSTDKEVPSSSGFRSKGQGSTGGTSSGTSDVKPKKAKVGVSKTFLDAPQGNFAGRAAFHNTLTKCLICDKDKYWDEMAYGCEVCEKCTERAWEGYRCPKCEINFKGYMVPQFVRRQPSTETHHGFTLFQCQNVKCRTILKIGDDNKDLPQLVKLSDAMPEDFTAKEFDEGLSEFLESETGPLSKYFDLEDTKDELLSTDEEFYQESIDHLRNEIEDLKTQIRECTDDVEKNKLVSTILDKIDEINLLENEGWVEDDFDVSAIPDIPPEVAAGAIARKGARAQADGGQPDFPELLETPFNGLANYD